VARLEHDVRISTPRLELGYAQFMFRVRKGKRLLGELGVSQGGLEWWGPYKKGKGKHMSWSSFGELAGAKRAPAQRTKRKKRP
jgi:hypothetical protein